MSRLAPQEFIRISEQLAAFQTVKCCLSHEQVRRDPVSSLPVLSSNPDATFDRFGLCPGSVRKLRLACGHTNARNHMRAALLRLSAAGEDIAEEIVGFVEQLNELDARICHLDHQKGFAEAAVAEKILSLARESPTRKVPEKLSSGLSEESRQIRTLMEQHALCVDEISDLRNRVLEYIERRKTAILGPVK